MTVTAVVGDQEFVVGGTVTGRDDEPRLVRALGYDVEIAHRAAHALRRQRRPARPHRPAGNAPRRGRRQHRQHGRLEEPPALARAHGADARQPDHARGARPDRAEPGLHRPARDRARARRATTSARSWPEPVERVAAVLREAPGRGADRGVQGGDADRRRRGAATGAPIDRSSSRSSSPCDGRADRRHGPR